MRKMALGLGVSSLLLVAAPTRVLALVAAISDPFGLGWDLFGTADRRVEFFIATGEPIWYFQLASIVGGTVLGVALAHDRALADFGDDATRPRYAMLLMMVALTALGLTILAG